MCFVSIVERSASKTSNITTSSTLTGGEADKSSSSVDVQLNTGNIAAASSLVCQIQLQVFLIQVARNVCYEDNSIAALSLDIHREHSIYSPATESTTKSAYTLCNQPFQDKSMRYDVAGFTPVCALFSFTHLFRLGLLVSGSKAHKHKHKGQTAVITFHHVYHSSALSF